MQKKLYFIAIFLLTAAVLIGTDKQTKTKLPRIPSQGPSQVPGKSEALKVGLKAIQKSDLQEMLYRICSPELGGRRNGSTGFHASLQYLEGILQASGLRTMRDRFDKNNCNLYGWLDGKEKPNEVIVLGAHLDSVGNSGADDNGSGSVGVVEIAKAFALIKNNRHTMVFQLYDAEEFAFPYGTGSAHYVKNPKFPINAPSMKQHRFMLNLDMIGKLSYQTSFYRAERGPNDIEEVINFLAPKYPFYNKITFQGGGGSDHQLFKPFCRVCWLFTGSHSDYHKSTDLPNRIDLEGLKNITKYAFEIMYWVDKMDYSPVRRSSAGATKTAASVF